MSVIVVGTMAFDAIETPFGKTDSIVGTSAVKLQDFTPDLSDRLRAL